MDTGLNFSWESDYMLAPVYSQNAKITPGNTLRESRKEMAMQFPPSLASHELS